MKKHWAVAQRSVWFAFFLSLAISHQSLFAQGGGLMKISSPDFGTGQMIPSAFTCQGMEVSPALNIEGIPDGTKSLALIVDDPDAPMGTWVHWVVYDITPRAEIRQGEIPGVQGINDSRGPDYCGPCPPSGTHRYFFKLYALDTVLGLKPGANKEELVAAMKGRILEQAELIGLYKKN